MIVTFGKTEADEKASLHRSRRRFGGLRVFQAATVTIASIPCDSNFDLQ